MFYIIRFLVMYMVLAVFCYFLYWEANLQFYKSGEQIELEYSEKKFLFIIMSMLWIIYVPKLLIDYFRR